ncbi:Lrp/AsnC family transcriptional regulator [Kiloniella laminariae]|uniref:Lrp/AsnC family transcriptional regulator n=1 Tax=Kiloniella laminariae TaxID=454162 RepID=A0ABT4LNM8_9PROT|nr:Lrp/AsnC family transcriptional regulator [Kiloniella laminariae]MCZ4282743.1 Lrp/AsnC family transcriptional regulator [Kiloniella laminariae]
MEIDGFDRSILRCLQQSTRFTSEQIAEKVGLSATACQRRIKRLRDTGAIEREVAVLSPGAVGNQLTLLVQIVVKRGRSDVIDAFKRDMQALPEVQQCYYVTGSFDFIMIVTASDITEYEHFTRRAFFDNPCIQEFTTTVVMERVKVGLEYPVK